MKKDLIIKKQLEEIKKLKKEKDELKKLIYLDYLTRVYNRRGLIEVSEGYFQSIKTTGKNYRKGDKVLKSFANFLRKNFRKTDIISRWGGEEFVILLINAPYELAEKIADKIRKKIDGCVFNGLKITVSIGVLSYTKESSLEELIDEADRLMYLAKKRGKNQVISKYSKCFPLWKK
ncbi:MAG: GGDEF domain-containing protein [Candidatus Paceibacterota bacterium]|jgi:GGDEF domain-containing protein